MSDDPVGGPVRRTGDDVLGRLAAIDHCLHQISIQLDEIRIHLETLIGSLEMAGRA